VENKLFKTAEPDEEVMRLLLETGYGIKIKKEMTMEQLQELGKALMAMCRGDFDEVSY
jgi:hypothetical protein